MKSKLIEPECVFNNTELLKIKLLINTHNFCVSHKFLSLLTVSFSSFIYTLFEVRDIHTSLAASLFITAIGIIIFIRFFQKSFLALDQIYFHRTGLTEIDYREAYIENYKEWAYVELTNYPEDDWLSTNDPDIRNSHYAAHDSTANKKESLETFVKKYVKSRVNKELNFKCNYYVARDLGLALDSTLAVNLK